MHSKKILSFAVPLFLAVELALGILMFRPNMGDVSRVLRFSSILIACLFCALFYERSREYVITQIAFVLAICADCCLVLPVAPIQLPGVLLFTASYLAYAVLLYITESRRVIRRVHVVARIAVPCVALAVAVLVLRESCDALALASVFCFANLGLNVLFAALQARRQVVLAVGFLLLFISDMVLGLSFITPYVALSARSMSYRMVHSGYDIVWAFYLPAQVLLALSLLPERWKRTKRTATEAISEGSETPSERE